MTSLYLGGVEMPTMDDISIPINFIIADIKDPSKRQSNHTLTVKIPSTKESDTFFEFIGDPTTALQTFNPNLKNTAVIKRNGRTILTGYVQLQGVVENWTRNTRFYNCKIQGLQAEFFYSLGEKYLTGNSGIPGVSDPDDLDFSEYDHDLTYVNLVDAWRDINQVNAAPVSVSAGEGYRYPLADYGFSGSGHQGGDTDFYVHHLRPMFSVYEYFTKMFTAAGKTFTSSFLTGAFFKSLYIPTTKKIQVSETERLARTFYVGETGTQNHITPLTYGGTTTWDGPTVNDLIYFPIETAPFTDPSGLNDSGTGVITIGATGSYTINAVLAFTVVVTNTGSSNGPIDNYTVTFDMTPKIQKRIAGIWTDVENGQMLSVTTASHSPSDPYVGSVSVTHVPGSPVAGDLFRVTLETVSTIQLLNAASNYIVDGTTDCNMQIGTGTTCTLSLLTNDIQEGDLLEANQCIPEGIKQRDFFLSIVKAFNLIMDVDKDDPNNYIIEPDPTFYGASTVDWTDKLDISEDIEITPMGELENKRLKFSYKSDTDHYNKLYQDEFLETYGSHTVELPSEFNTSEHKTELIFSATPMVGNNTNGLIIPAMFKSIGGVDTPVNAEPAKFNIRLWIYGGIVPFAGMFTVKSVAGDVSFPNNAVSITGYPYAGHLDDPYNPTMDLCFDNPQEVYWDQVSQYVTDNLYTIYHEPIVDEISHKDSKTVKMWFNLDEEDIKDFDFRNYVRVLNCVYYVNAINGFDANEERSTQVELLKLTS